MACETRPCDYERKIMASKHSVSMSEQPSVRKPKRLCSFSSSWLSEEFEAEYN